MRIVRDDKPSLEELMHFGVKGMRWGERKAPKPTTADIHAARGRHNDRINQLHTLNAQSVGASQAKRRQLAQKVSKIADEGLKSGDVSVASRATTGEKVVAALLSGGVGVLVVKSRMREQKKNATKVLNAYKNSPQYVG